MTEPHHSPTIFLLGREDVDEVATLERDSFPLAWTPDVFARILRNERLPLSSVRKASLADVAVFGLRFSGKTIERVDNAGQGNTAFPLLGYMSIRLVPLAGEAEIYNVAVQPACRGKGYGTLLVSAVLQKLATCSMQEVFLEAREGNIAALSLYKRCGFVQYGIRKRYYDDGENAVLMRLEISKE
jgi:Acetyltransferases